MYNKKRKVSYDFKYIASDNHQLNMYIDTNKETPLPEKNQYNSIKSSENPKQISWKTVSEFKEKINKVRNDLVNSNKEESKDEGDYERKRRKLNYTNCWEEDLTNYGYARCLRTRCNFISNNIRIIKSHYKDCNGVPHFKEHFCSNCQNYLSSSKAHVEHVLVCKGFNKYNQKDYKYESGLRTRKSVSKIPLDRFLSWQDQILNQGLACCGYNMCSYVSSSFSDLEKHYVTCCGIAGVKARYCAHCHFKSSSEDEFAQHQPNCLGYIRWYQKNVEKNYGCPNKTIKNVNENKEKKLIVQSRSDLKVGDCKQQRPCTQQHVRSWKLALSNDRSIKCSVPNCTFVAMSLEGMIRHFSFCDADSNFTQVLCPYCRGRVASEDVLREHIERFHTNNVDVGSNTKQMSSNHVSNNGRKTFLAGVLANQPNNQSERRRPWQMQTGRFGHAYCMELNCNFVAKTWRELEIHVRTCREIAKKKLTTCRKCKTKLPKEQLDEHRSKCYDSEDERKNSKGKTKPCTKSSPTKEEQRGCKTYSRKRKVSFEDESNGGYVSNKRAEKEPMLVVLEGGEESEEDDDIQVLEREDEGVKAERPRNKSTRQDSREVEMVQEESKEYDSDKNDVEIIEERAKGPETKGSDQRGLNRYHIEVVEIDAEIETLDTVEEEEEQKKLESEDEIMIDEEREKVETVEMEELESKGEEPEKIESVEDELGMLENEEETEENVEAEKVNGIDNRKEEAKNVEVDELEEEMVVKTNTVEGEKDEKDEAEKPENRSLNTPESVIPNDIEDGENEESTKLSRERKENTYDKGSGENYVDSFGLDESDDDEEEPRMEIDEGVMSTIFETLDDDFDKCNPPYSVIGNEIEVFEGNENSQGTLIALPNDDSQSFLINEDTGTLDRSEPATTDDEQVLDNEQVEESEGVEGSGQGESGQGVEQSGGQNDDTSSDDTRDRDSEKESENGRSGRRKTDDNDDGDGDGDGRKSGNRKKAEKSEDSDNAEESEEKDDDEDEEIVKMKEDGKTKETSKKRVEKELRSSKGSCRNEEKYQDMETEKPKEDRRSLRSGNTERNKPTEKEKKRPVRKSKRLSEEDGGEVYIPKGLTGEEDESEDEGESIARNRGRRGQSKPNNELPVKPTTGKKTLDTVKCGKCHCSGVRDKFDQHNWTKHFGLGWLEGEKEVDLNNEEEVTNLVKEAFKVVKKGVCEICKEVKRSYLGFAWHVLTCGKSPTELDALKVKCPHCSMKFLTYSLKTHIYVFHGEEQYGNKNDNDGEGVDLEPDTNENASKDVDTESQAQIKTRKVSKKSHKKADKEGDDTTQGSNSQEPVVSSSKRKSALRAVSKFQEAFKDNAEQFEEKEEEEKPHESGYLFYEKGGKLPRLCYKLCNLWYSLKRSKKMIPCRHLNCNIVSRDVKEAKLHHFTCSKLPSEVYFCELCDYYSVDECDIQSHVKLNHKRPQRRCRENKEYKESKEDADFSEDEDDYLDEDHLEEDEDEDDTEDSDYDFEWCDSVYERQKKRKKKKKKTTTTTTTMTTTATKKKKNKKKVEEDEKKTVRKGVNSDSEEDTTELVHKQNFCEREKLENLRGDEFYSNALEMTREFEEGCNKDGDGEDENEEEIKNDEKGKEQIAEEVVEMVEREEVGGKEVTEEEVAGEEVTKEEVAREEVTEDEVAGEEVTEEEAAGEEVTEEENSEVDYSGVWPTLHTESEDWCCVSQELASSHLPELLESISVSFVKNEKTELNWNRFKRFEGEIVDEVPVMFVGASIRSMSWCKVSFRRTLETTVKQYLAVSTAKGIDHLTDVHKSRGHFPWNLLQIWDCGVLENSRPIEAPKFALGIFQEGGEIWDMLWFPEDTYGKGLNGSLGRIGILATAADDGAVRIWSICEPNQIASDMRLPLYITEPLIKLTIDTFLEDSCVRLSIGKDGIIAGGYVNGSLAVWNLNNITSPFCEKIGKCVVIKPHLIIQAHRTSITALTFCPSNSRYITSGGLDRVVKLWDLESPWVPIEQYQRELCLDNIWPKNWPMNIHNFEDVYPNNRKGVIRFVKDVISSKHSPCLILDNTCLSLSFSDWLNSICGCNNTGEVKIRFFKNFLRDQDKKPEKNQSTLSSLRLERLNDGDDSDLELAPAKEGESPKPLPKTYAILNAHYGIVITDHSVKDKEKPRTDVFHPEDFPIRAVNKVSFNPNFKSFSHIAVGYNCGVIRILRLNELEFNRAIKAFSENARKPRL